MVRTLFNVKILQTWVLAAASGMGLRHVHQAMGPTSRLSWSNTAQQRVTAAGANRDKGDSA